MHKNPWSVDHTQNVIIDLNHQEDDLLVKIMCIYARVK